MNEALARKIEILKKHLPEIKQKFHVKEIGIFGSYAHGDQNEKSDIDILVEYDKEKEPGFFKFLELERYLKEILDTKVDLVTKGGLKPRIKKKILNDLVNV